MRPSHIPLYLSGCVLILVGSVESVDLSRSKRIAEKSSNLMPQRKQPKSTKLRSGVVQPQSRHLVAHSESVVSDAGEEPSAASHELSSIDLPRKKRETSSRTFDNP